MSQSCHLWNMSGRKTGRVVIRMARMRYFGIKILKASAMSRSSLNLLLTKPSSQRLQNGMKHSRKAITMPMWPFYSPNCTIFNLFNLITLSSRNQVSQDWCWNMHYFLHQKVYYHLSALLLPLTMVAMSPGLRNLIPCFTTLIKMNGYPPCDCNQFMAWFHLPSI